MVHRIYLAPGMFGFGRLGSYDYFVHLERAFAAHFQKAGHDAELYVVDVAPTASVRRRAVRLAELVSRTSGDRGPIHLVGHSTGGLDARLVASPSVTLPLAPSALAWLPRLASITTMNTPHHGTPVASFFATVSGQRMLYALSALTYIALTIGAPPLAAVSQIVMELGRIDRIYGVALRLIDRSADSLLRVLDDARSREVRAYLDAIKRDQGAMIQLMPEAMDLFQSAVEDRPGVIYQSTASMAPTPSARGWARSLVNPWSTLSATLFAMLYGIASRHDEVYPCAAADVLPQHEQAFTRAFGRLPTVRASDGVVPILSQAYGKLLWAGYGDHLDVLGHFRDERGTGEHKDWLASGSSFDRGQFGSLTTAIVRGMLNEG